MSEEWRPVPGFPDYAVSSFGRVKRVVPDRHGRISNLPLKPVLGNHGYYAVSLHRDTVQSVRLVHRIVCEAFHGPAPSDRFHAAHGDGNRAHNHAANLRWASASANNLDKHRHGTMRTGAAHHAHARPECMPRGSGHGNAKLTEAAITSIRTDTRPQRVIAGNYGVSQSLISQVKAGRLWAHVEGRR